MPNIGPVELIIILVIALLILGPGRLPDVGSALGKSIREFRKAATDVQESVKLDTPPASPAAPAPAAPAPAAPAAAAPNTLGQAATPNVLATPVAPVEPAAAEAATEPAAAAAETTASPDPEPVAASREPKA
jgi:TatA/E family protein of Tat protein translocase